MAEPASAFSIADRPLYISNGAAQGFFFSPFSGGLPKVNTRVFFFFFFPPLTDGPTQAITFLKIKNMANLVKQCRGAS
jgi:hypothetical protein